jgi:hypothetical protein
LARTLSKDPEPMPAPLSSNRQSEVLEVRSCLRGRRGWREQWLASRVLRDYLFFFPLVPQPWVLLGSRGERKLERKESVLVVVEKTRRGRRRDPRLEMTKRRRHAHRGLIYADSP